MDFRLDSLTLAEAAATKSPALMVLVADGFEPGADALSALIQRALASGDFKTEAGALLSSYGAARVTAERVVLVGVGDASGPQVRKAVAAGVLALRGSPATSLLLCFAQPADAAAVRAATLGVAESCYAMAPPRARRTRKTRRRRHRA